MTAEQRLAELGLKLPPVSAPVGNYVNYVRTGNLLYLGGKGPRAEDGLVITGKVGAEVSLEQAYQHARNVALGQIAVLKEALGDLERVRQVVKVLGMVNAAPDFKEHPQVINGFSDLIVAVFGEKGRHARAAVGMGSLPSQITVEIEMIVEVTG